MIDFQQSPLPEIRSRSLEVTLHLEKVITTVGPRRAGKTFYLYQVVIEIEKRGVSTLQIAAATAASAWLILICQNNAGFLRRAPPCVQASPRAGGEKNPSPRRPRGYTALKKR